jgi:NAD(P)H-dependent flavin oxidoreductase YrpB (nitropropane dioxygenase family)
MKNPFCEMFGLDIPLFAFSHCRDVVVEVSKAGGLGVLGAVGFTPSQLAEELRWIERELAGKPYGVDLVIPARFIRGEADEELTADKLWEFVPPEHGAFAHELCDRFAIPPLGDSVEVAKTDELGWKESVAREQFETAMTFSPAAIINALGAPPADIVERIHARGIKVGGLAGRVRHALKQRDAGVDFVVANGHEAAGHTGDITTMVLVPQIAAALAPMPVLAAGGIGSGAQMAAALMLGAQGVWTGSLWLGSAESELHPLVKRKLYDAGSEQTARTRCVTGKPARHLVTPYTAAWDDPNTLDPLPMPLQTMATSEALQRISRSLDNNEGARELATNPIGQVVGLITEEQSVRHIVQAIKEGFLESVERMNAMVYDS